MADFFHPEDKERYLAQAKWAAPYSRVIFLRSSELEYTLNMDLATMDKAEIVSVLNSFDLLAFETIQGLISAIRHYLGWYRQNIDVGTNNVDDIYIVKEDLDIVGSMKRNLFTNWNQILIILGTVKYNLDNGDATAALITLLWLGFRLPRAFEFKANQVDTVNGLIFDENHILIYRNVEPKYLKVLRRYHDAALPDPNGCFITLKKTHQPVYSVNGAITGGKLIGDIAKKYELATRHPIPFTPSTLYYSGLYNRLHEYMRQNPDITDKAVKKQIRQIANTPNGELYKVMFMYNKYKEAFRL